MENSIKNQLEESRKDGTLKETLQGMGFNRLQSIEIAKGLNNEVILQNMRIKSMTQRR